MRRIASLLTSLILLAGAKPHPPDARKPSHSAEACERRLSQASAEWLGFRASGGWGFRCGVPARIFVGFGDCGCRKNGNLGADPRRQEGLEFFPERRERHDVAAHRNAVSRGIGGHYGGSESQRRKPGYLGRGGAQRHAGMGLLRE